MVTQPTLAPGLAPQNQGRPGPPRSDRRDRRRHNSELEHLLRRAAFGVGPAEEAAFEDLSLSTAIDRLVDYDRLPDQVDDSIGTPGFVGVTTSRPLTPNTSISDARQRWLFRMVHSERPLQEKMALFWHNHFATSYGKVAGAYGTTDGARMMAANPTEDPGRVLGQIELFRSMAVGNFRDLLVAVAQDPAMLIWLDGRLNVKTRPQENFAREIMELFTLGVGFYTEPDVYAGARVFSGWNLQRIGASNDPTNRYTFIYNATQHDTDPKTFSFPVYRDGSRTIPARAQSAGMQDGLDFIEAIATHPETARRLARKLYAFFVSETLTPDQATIDSLAEVYLRNNTEIKPVLRALFGSPAFQDSSAYYTRYTWPVEFVVRTLKEVGWSGFSVADALTPLSNMGQVLYEPPNVSGWGLGRLWFSSATLLARMNFAASLAKAVRPGLVAASREGASSPERLLSWMLDRVTVSPIDRAEYDALLDYLDTGGAWTGSDTQLAAKVPGLAHLLTGSARYQFI